MFTVPSFLPRSGPRRTVKPRRLNLFGALAFIRSVFEARPVELLLQHFFLPLVAFALGGGAAVQPAIGLGLLGRLLLGLAFSKLVEIDDFAHLDQLRLVPRSLVGHLLCSSDRCRSARLVWEVRAQTR